MKVYHCINHSKWGESASRGLALKANSWSQRGSFLNRWAPVPSPRRGSQSSTLRGPTHGATPLVCRQVGRDGSWASIKLVTSAPTLRVLSLEQQPHDSEVPSSLAGSEPTTFPQKSEVQPENHLRITRPQFIYPPFLHHPASSCSSLLALPTGHRHAARGLAALAARDFAGAGPGSLVAARRWCEGRGRPGLAKSIECLRYPGRCRGCIGCGSRMQGAGSSRRGRVRDVVTPQKDEKGSMFSALQSTVNYGVWFYSTAIITIIIHYMYIYSLKLCNGGIFFSGQVDCWARGVSQIMTA